MLQLLNDRIYKLYNIVDRKEYEGMCNKYECDMHGEHGIFKEPLGYGTKDHIVEAIVYQVCCLCGVECAFARVRKTEESIGVFSRFEIPEGYNFMHASVLFGTWLLHVSDLLGKTAVMAKEFRKPTLLTILYKYLIIDYLTGQLDRHMDNMAILEKNGKPTWYKLYDNGLALGGNYSNTDIAIKRLNSGFFNTRVGSSTEIREELIKYKNSMKLGKIILPAITYRSVSSIIDACDIYNQLCKSRRESMVNFMLRQKKDIESW